jgi:hypothetical protein
MENIIRVTDQDNKPDALIEELLDEESARIIGGKGGIPVNTGIRQPSGD